jgi:hypothetical protein
VMARRLPWRRRSAEAPASAAPFFPTSPCKDATNVIPSSGSSKVPQMDDLSHEDSRLQQSAQCDVKEASAGEAAPCEEIVQADPPSEAVVTEMTAKVDNQGASDSESVEIPSALQRKTSESESVEIPSTLQRKRKHHIENLHVPCSQSRAKLVAPTEQLGGQADEDAAEELAAPPRPLCVICRHPPWRPQVSAVCGHFACDDCWGRWVCVKFECPVCRAKVRPNNLIRLRGWGDS